MRIATLALTALLLTALAPAVAAAEAPLSSNAQSPEVTCDQAGLPPLVCDLIDLICALIDRLGDALKDALPPSMWALIEPIFDTLIQLCEKLR